MRTRFWGSVTLGLALLLAMSHSPVGAGENVEISGQLRYRGEASRKAFDNDVGFNTFQLMRTRVAVTFLPGQRSWARVMLQDSRVLGVPYSGGLEQDQNVGIQEAYVWVDDVIVPGLSFQAGRFQMAYGNERLIGPVGWSNIGRTFDGARLRLASSGLELDGFWVKREEKERPENDDVDLFGLYLKLKEAKAEFFLIHDLDNRRGFEHKKRLRRWTAGAYSTRDFAGGFDYVSNVAFQFGKMLRPNKELSIQAFLIAAELGFRPHTESHWRVALGIDWASGDADLSDDTYKAFDNLYYTGHRFRGYMDYFLASTPEGLIDLYLRQSLKPGQWWFGLDAHLFRTGAEYASRVDNENTSAVGIELDATAKSPPVGKARFQFGGSLFLPSEDWAGQDADPGFWGYLMLTLNVK
jgi:hypothetical protein